MSSAARYHAIQTATSRETRIFDIPVDSEGYALNVEDYFGCQIFGLAQMRQRLPAEIVNRFEDCLSASEKLDIETADAIAFAVYQWALENGASHFCHWFQPMTGSTAEKHDGFINLGGPSPEYSFSGAQLIQSEPDASSFPNGGVRTTFEARGYTGWDPSSPIFIMERENGKTLCIPSVFVSYFGDALDKKAPLLRSMSAISEKAKALCHALGDVDVEKITVNAGPEQEYFLIDSAYAALRPDLLLAGRTVLGAAAPKGQSLDDHYFGAIPSRIASFMHELEVELYKVGVPAKTRHNEVAPSQFELAVVYDEANIAADHNQLVMELIQRVAERHNLKALLHEKPFAGVNGSGKHVNWSMSDNFGKNLLSPGRNPAQNTRFLAVLASIILGVHKHAGLLRASIATYSNDFRLGANEAPPAIISVFLGDALTKICNAIQNGTALPELVEQAKLDIGSQLPDLDQDNTDRNRTSPFAFTGNKFEFRAAGSSSSISLPITCVNAAVADGMTELTALIAEYGVEKALQLALQKSSAIRFEGDNYSDAWVEEAASRGLPNLKKTPDALAVLTSDQSKELFSGLGIYSERELSASYHVLLEQYITNVTIELDVLNQLIDQAVVPAAIAERTAACADVAAQGAVFGDDVDRSRAVQLQQLIKDLNSARAELKAAQEKCDGTEDEFQQALLLAYEVAPAAEAVRAVCDDLELICSDERWALPKYREMLFQN